MSTSHREPSVVSISSDLLETLEELGHLGRAVDFYDPNADYDRHEAFDLQLEREDDFERVADLACEMGNV